MPDVMISDETMSLLKQLARPLEDTPDTLIARLAKDAVKNGGAPSESKAIAGNSPKGAQIDPLSLKHVSKMSPAVNKLYEEIVEIISDFDGAHVHGVKTYIGCRVGARNFAAVFPQKAGLAVWIRPEAAGLKPGENGERFGVQLHRPDRMYWPLDTRFIVAPGVDLSGVAELLRASYNHVAGTASPTASTAT